MGDEFFFIISGFFLAQAACRTDESPVKWNTQNFIKRLEKIAIPYYLSWLACFIGRRITNHLLGRPVGFLPLDIANSIYELLFLEMLGFKKGLYSNDVAWFFSALLIVSFMIGPWIVKYKQSFCLYCAPLVIVFSYGILSLYFDYLYYPGKLIGNSFVQKGIVRAMAAVCIGSFLYGLLSIKPFKLFIKEKCNIFIITITDIVLWLILFCYMIYPFYILTILYSINFEQTVVILVVFPLYLIAENRILKRPNNNLIYLTLILGILGVGFNITCPGNLRRIILEINKWFPTFQMLSLPDKIMIGVSDTLFHLTKTPVLLYVVFLLCLFIYSHFRFHNSVYDIVNILPIVFVSVSAVLPLYRSGIPAMRGYYLINGDSLNHIVTFVLFIMADWLLFFWPLIGMSMIFDDKVKFFRAAMVYLTGFGIRVLMGLSPTVYISGSRTFLPVYLSLLIIIF